jgi:predicted GNAT superfamily acetyltransferase
MTVSEMTIRPAISHEDFDACVELQRCIWHGDDLEIVSREIFVIAAKTGGQVFAAFADQQMIGFTLAFAAVRDEEIYLHSHLAAVLPEFQNRRVGYSLKLQQRREALARGIRRMEWTFDPLELRNAYFNFHRLGAVARCYLPNFYGTMTNILQAGLPSDRLMVEWLLDSPHVQSALSANLSLPPDEICHRLCISQEIKSFKQTNLPAAADVQADLREQLLKLFAEGFQISDFERDAHSGTYLLTKQENLLHTA